MFAGVPGSSRILLQRLKIKNILMSPGAVDAEGVMDPEPISLFHKQRAAPRTARKATKPKGDKKRAEVSVKEVMPEGPTVPQKAHISGSDSYNNTTTEESSDEGPGRKEKERIAVVAGLRGKSRKKGSGQRKTRKRKSEVSGPKQSPNHATGPAVESFFVSTGPVDGLMASDRNVSSTRQGTFTGSDRKVCATGLQGSTTSGARSQAHSRCGSP